MIMGDVPEGYGVAGFKSFWGQRAGYNELRIVVGIQRIVPEGVRVGTKHMVQNWSTGGSRLCLEKDDNDGV